MCRYVVGVSLHISPNLLCKSIGHALHVFHFFRSINRPECPERGSRGARSPTAEEKKIGEGGLLNDRIAAGTETALNAFISSTIQQKCQWLNSTGFIDIHTIFRLFLILVLIHSLDPIYDTTSSILISRKNDNKRHKDPAPHRRG